MSGVKSRSSPGAFKRAFGQCYTARAILYRSLKFRAIADEGCFLEARVEVEVIGMLSLTDFLALLPSIKPRVARQLVLTSDLLLAVEKEDIHSRGSFYGPVYEVGPDAAAAILAAYKQGRLPMKAGKRPAVAPEAEHYLAQRDILRQELHERSRKTRAIDDPSLILERDLADHWLIDRVFRKHVGAGTNSMSLAGTLVHKQVTPYKSNSGKSVGWHVRFDWVSSDGTPRHSENRPGQMGNRLNDPDRKWGLHD